MQRYHNESKNDQSAIYIQICITVGNLARCLYCTVLTLNIFIFLRMSAENGQSQIDFTQNLLDFL